MINMMLLLILGNLINVNCEDEIVQIAAVANTQQSEEFSVFKQGSRDHKAGEAAGQRGEDSSINGYANWVKGGHSIVSSF